KEPTINHITDIVRSLSVDGDVVQTPHVSTATGSTRTATASRGRTQGPYRRKYGRAPTVSPANSRAPTNGDKSEPRATASSSGRFRSARRRKWNSRDAPGGTDKDDGNRPAKRRMFFTGTNGASEWRKRHTYPVCINGVKTFGYLDTAAAITCL